MSIQELKDILHKIRVKLYPNYLPKAEGKYIARTNNEATLTVADICTTSINRGGFTDKYDDYVDHVNQFMEELVYQLLDGYAVSTGYFSIHPNIGGTFDSDKEAHDHAKHPITFRFRALEKLRRLAGKINVEIEGIADTGGYIMEFTDVTTGAVNESYSPPGEFVITGYKLKVAGDHPDVGVYLEMVGGTAKLKAGRLAENSQSKLIGTFPPGPPGTFKIVIKTQFAGSGNTFLKTPRTIESGFTVTM